MQEKRKPVPEIIHNRSLSPLPRPAIEVFVDLEEMQELNEISAGFLQVVNHIVFFPTEVRDYASEDGEKFDLLGTVPNAAPLQADSKINDIQHFRLSVPNIRARFFKIEAQSLQTAPVWHHGAGLPCWIFMDEWEVKVGSIDHRPVQVCWAEPDIRVNTAFLIHRHAWSWIAIISPPRMRKKALRWLNITGLC